MFFARRIDKDYVDLVERMNLMERRFKEIREDLEKVEIKALESQKIYRRKLKNLTGEEKQEEDLNKSIFLNPHGSPI